MTDVAVGQVWRRKRDGRGVYVWSTQTDALGRQLVRLCPNNLRYSSHVGGPVLALNVTRNYDLVEDTPRTSNLTSSEARTR